MDLPLAFCCVIGTVFLTTFAVWCVTPKSRKAERHRRLRKWRKQTVYFGPDDCHPR